MELNMREVAKIPPIMPINGMINSRIDFLARPTLTLIGDISYLKNIPDVPCAPSS
jgi:hypothetical protein